MRLALATAFATLAPAAHGDGGLARPLHLPTVDGRCPVTATQGAGGAWLSVTRDVLLQDVGRPPRPATIDIAGSLRDARGWRGQKTPWLLPERRRGPILIRGRRLDAPGVVEFAKVSGRHLRALRFAAGESNGVRRPSGFRGRFRFLASESLFRSPGCYGFQIDGRSFSAVVVVRVRG